MESWAKRLACAVTVCDRDGTILDMNDKAIRTFAKEGGQELISKNLFDCHSPASQEKIKGLMGGQEANVYTIEKDGKKKLIYQAPWYEDDRLMGLVELSLEIPPQMPHFKRD
jgi:hypothetical protein